MVILILRARTPLPLGNAIRFLACSFALMEKLSVIGVLISGTQGY